MKIIPNVLYSMLIFTVLAIAVIVFTASVTAQEGDPEPPIELVIEESCTSNFILREAPNGVSGFAFEVAAEVRGANFSEIAVDTTLFPLNMVKPVQAVVVSGVDLNELIQSGATNVLLFSISPCVSEVIVRILDDDNGFPIIPAGTVITLE